MFEQTEAIFAIEFGDGAFSSDEYAQLLAFRDRMEAHFSRATAVFEQSAQWAFDGAATPVQWLVAFGRLSSADAHRLLKLGATCRQLPVTSAALADGTLSVGQVGQIAAHLSTETIELFAEHEAELIPTLAGLNVKRLGWAMGHWQRKAEARLGLERNGEAPERSLHLSPIGRGRWRLDGDLDTEAGALLDTAIRLATTADVEGEPIRSPGRKRADAAADIARYYLDHYDGAKVARRRTHLDVIVTVEALEQGQTGELMDGTIVDATTMARLACDADVHRVIMDRSSTVLDYGRRARVVPNGLRGALNVRDRHCRFPGCDRPPAWCEAHHIVDWINGGHTRPDNLVLLCSRHHHIVHLDGWKHVLHPDNTFEVLTPDGRRLESRPMARAPAG